MYKFFIILFSFSLLFANQIKHILILNSYHQTLNWSQDVLRAVYDVLQPEKNGYIFHMENMDTKRAHSKKYISQLKEIYKEKYKNIKFSLILANDNNAYNFLRKYRDEIFGPVPTVFCGVNFFHKEDLKGLKNFTGVAETIDPAGTVKAALKMFPNTKHIFILNDYLNTGVAFTKQSVQDIKKMNIKDIKIHVIKNLTMKELQHKLSHLPKDSIVVMGVYFKDKNGVFYTPDYAAKLISKSSIAPVFVLVDIYLKHEMIGGSVDGGYYQGLAMAKIAKRILNGEDINKIPPIESGVTQYVFNYTGLKKFGINLDLLPKGSIVINKPLTFFERYKLAIQIAAVIIFILLIAIIILILQNKKVKVAKNELQKLKDNLEILVQKRTKSLKESKKEMEELLIKTQDAINYAFFIQEALLPKEELFKEAFKDYFIIYIPKDTVGGDIYQFFKLNQKEYLLLVIDCTGHGVPGAFVTMLVKAITDQMIFNLKEKKLPFSPAAILNYFNSTIKYVLKQYEDSTSKSNVGFDGGVLYYNKKENIIKYAGAETSLFYVKNNEVKIIKGDRVSIGYKKSKESLSFKEHTIQIKEGMKFYLTTDGFIDQNGGEKDFPFGKKRFIKLIEKYHHLPMKKQKEKFLAAISEWKKDEQNDDITVIAFEP